MVNTVSQYHEIWLAPFFHGFPHIDMTFQHTNSTFDPENTNYREALIFLAALPVLWCILSLLVFCCYFTIRCCQKATEKRKKATCLRVFIAVTIIIGIGSVSVGLFGNEEASDGIENFQKAVKDTNKTIEDALNTLNSLDGLVNDVADRGVGMLQNVTNEITNSSIKSKIQGFIGTIGDQTKQVLMKIQGIRLEASHTNLDQIEYVAEEFEFYRMVATIILYSIHLVLLVLLLLGVYKKSKCLLIASSAMSLFFLLFTWSAMGFYLGFSVATGDFCVNPESFVEQEVASTIDRAVLKGYLDCKDNTGPFLGNLTDAQTAVGQANAALNMTVTLAKPFLGNKLAKPVTLLKTDLKYATGNLSQLTNVVSCKHIHNNYIQAVNGICVKALPGLAFMLLMTGVVGLALTFAVALASRAWPHFGKKRGYALVDDTDPFLPRPPPYDTYGTMNDQQVLERNVSTVSLSRSIVNEERDIQTMPLYGPPAGESPPPAYHSGAHMQQYRSLAPRPSNLQDTSEA